jgi:hypothetical protein
VLLNWASEEEGEKKEEEEGEEEDDEEGEKKKEEEGGEEDDEEGEKKEEEGEKKEEEEEDDEEEDDEEGETEEEREEECDAASLFVLLNGASEEDWEEREGEEDEDEDEEMHTFKRWLKSPNCLFQKATRSPTFLLILLNSKYTLSTFCLLEIGSLNLLPSSGWICPSSRANLTSLSKSYSSSYNSRTATSRLLMS